MVSAIQNVYVCMCPRLCIMAPATLFSNCIDRLRYGMVIDNFLVIQRQPPANKSANT